MKYFIALLSTTVLSYFAYIFYQKQKLDGIWLLYQLEYKQENVFEKISTPNSLLKIDFSKFQYISHGGYSGSLNYSFNGFTIVLKAEKEDEFPTALKMKVDSNKLVLEDNGQRQTFVKISNKLKSDHNINEILKSKTFLVKENEIIIDTLSFNRNTIFSKSSKNYKWVETKFKRKRINNIEFYLSDGYFIYIPNNIENQLFINVVNDKGEIIQYKMDEM